MLQLRPICENCAKPLPPHSTEAMICSYECTFCAACVRGVLHNACPNCGGGFEKRPVRPSTDWRNGNTVAKDPPVATRKHKPIDQAAHDVFAIAIRAIPPERR
jgi:hypothetical protein